MLRPTDQGATIVPWRFTQRGVALRLFLSCWFVYALHFATNIVREIYPAISLGEHLSFDVTEYVGLHPDIFVLPERGAFINNNPGASIVGAIPYGLARPLVTHVTTRVQQARAAMPQTTEREYKSIYPLAQEFYRQVQSKGLDVKLGLAAAITQVLCMAPLSALSVVVMFYLLLYRTTSIPVALWLAVLYAFATPVLYRTAQLNHNLLVGHCALFALAVLWRPWDAPQAQRRPQYWLAGLLAGWAVVLDYSGIIVLLGMSLYALLQRSSLPEVQKSRHDFWHFASGAALSLLVLLLYQWYAFGHPLYPAQHYMPPTTYSPYGYQGMSGPRLALLWDTAFHLRFGLFPSAPLLLLVAYFPAWAGRQRRIVPGPELWGLLGYCVLFFMFCAANQYGYMQFNSGVRHIVPVTPVLFLFVADVLLALPRLPAALLGILTTYWSWCLAMYRDVEQGLGVLESLRHITLEGFRLPFLSTLQGMGYVVESATALPLLALSAALLWALWNVGAQRPQQVL